jgi:hypothetical protein
MLTPIPIPAACLIRLRFYVTVDSTSQINETTGEEQCDRWAVYPAIKRGSHFATLAGRLKENCASLKVGRLLAACFRRLKTNGYA